MRIPDAILASVVGLLLAPVLLPLGAGLLISVAALLVPVIPVLAVVALTTLIVLAARRVFPWGGGSARTRGARGVPEAGGSVPFNEEASLDT